MRTPEQLLQALEHAERRVGVPTEARARVLDGIMNRLACGEAVELAPEVEPLFASEGTGLVVVAKLLVVAALVVGVVLVADTRLPVPRASTPPRVVEVMPSVDLTAPAPEIDRPSIRPAVALESSAEPQIVSRPSKPRHARRAATRSLPIRSEFELIVELEQAFDEQRFERALELVREHEREFATGSLVEERLALEARVLCRLGRISEGTQRSARLRARFPRTIHETALRHDCAAPADES